MPQVSRHICTNCQRSIYNVMVDGQRVPLVMYFVVGQPADTGAPIDINGEGVKVPSFIRELMHTDVPRVELCMECVGLIFGVPLVTAQEDPMYGVGAMPDIPAGENDELGVVEKASITHERTLYALLVARGEVVPPEEGRTLLKLGEYEAYQEYNKPPEPPAEPVTAPATLPPNNPVSSLGDRTEPAPPTAPTPKKRRIKK